MSHGFCSKFHVLSSIAKIFEIQLRFDKVTDSLKLGTFFSETQCIFPKFIKLTVPGGISAGIIMQSTIPHGRFSVSALLGENKNFRHQSIEIFGVTMMVG